LLELHIRRVASGEFTEQVFGGMQEKTLLRIEGPLGQFWFREQSPRPAVMIGGGTGYAPLRAMLKQLLERGDRRPLHLYWGAQAKIDLYEDAILREWCDRHRNFKYTPVLSNPKPADDWAGRTGWVHQAMLDDHASQLSGLDVYASGPPAMVEAIRSELIARGLPKQQLFFDSFDFAPDSAAKLTSATTPQP
jgi:CDP-4-dehydro-6-deoxyglucose reductase